uniref:EF-hand domain-containing protein n=1 Tax=Haptolina brevifila TaxID=156173 RepID=A0A7S2BNG4_9EUKA|mmetsp:Transcript_14681/g.29441  ORF Transcript_14681/g.29441 Transcript_14681/m.29441 type:complete len:152 (+) Transcript_14681:534-989(+)
MRLSSSRCLGIAVIEAMKAMQGAYAASEYGDDAYIKDDVELVDKNGDGELDYKEFFEFERARLEILGETIDDEKLNVLFHEMDKDNSGKISLSELIDRRVKAVERAMKEDAEVFSENLVEGGLAVVASGEITETIGKHAHQSGLTHGEVMA